MRVLLDPFHLLKRYSDRLASTVDPVAKICTIMFRDALFINAKADEDEVREYLKARGMTDEDIKRVGHTFFVRVCRRAIPPPIRLAARLQAVYDVFQHAEMSNGKKLFKSRQGRTSSMEEEHKSIIRHVLSGCVSDHPDVPLYCSLTASPGAVSAALPRHKCYRGSPQLEGLHRHLYTCVKGWNMSPEMMDAIFLEYAVTWNMQTQEPYKDGSDPGHTDYDLLDRLVEKEQVLWGGDHTLFPTYVKTIKVGGLPSTLALPVTRKPADAKADVSSISQVTKEEMEMFGCGREISTDREVMQMNAEGNQGQPSDTGNEEALQELVEEFEGQEEVGEGAQFFYRDEDQLMELLQDAERPFHLSTARQTGGKCPTCKMLLQTVLPSLAASNTNSYKGYFMSICRAMAGGTAGFTHYLRPILHTR